MDDRAERAFASRPDAAPGASARAIARGAACAGSDDVALPDPPSERRVHRAARNAVGMVAPRPPLRLHLHRAADAAAGARTGMAPGRRDALRHDYGVRAGRADPDRAHDLAAPDPAPPRARSV